MGNHRLGSHGYTGKRPVWAKEDAERERQGIPDPLPKFTDQQEHDFIRARFSWDPKKSFFSPTGRLEIHEITGNYPFTTLHISF